MSQLRTVVRERPDSNDLKLVRHDAQAVLSDRHVIAHSVALEASWLRSSGIPRRGRETQITATQVLGHVQDIRIATRRVQEVIAAEAGVS